MATLTVLNTNDSGVGSLRQAILALMTLNIVVKTFAFVGSRVKIFLRVWERVKKELREGSGNEIIP